jgi:hypothetical protein
VSKIDLGNKRLCNGCGARFYDLGKNPVPCPKCKVVSDANAPVKIRRKSKASAPIDNDDPLVKQKAKHDARNKVKKPSKTVVELDDFEYIAPLDGDDEIEALDEIDDIEAIDELEVSETEESLDDDITLDDDSIVGEVLIDEIEDEEIEDVDEDEAPSPKGKKKR